jgi:hypothetical protein
VRVPSRGRGGYNCAHGRYARVAPSGPLDRSRDKHSVSSSNRVCNCLLWVDQATGTPDHHVLQATAPLIILGPRLRFHHQTNAHESKMRAGLEPTAQTKEMHSTVRAPMSWLGYHNWHIWDRDGRQESRRHVRLSR